MNPTSETIDGLLATVTRLGNDALVAQARHTLEAHGMDVTPEMCVAAFVGAAHILHMAERSHDVGTLSANEMVACQAVASLCMQIWATLHDIVNGDIKL